MARRVEEKDRQYYMDECYRLRYELKALREKSASDKQNVSSANYEEKLQEKSKKIQSLRTELCRLKKEQSKKKKEYKEEIERFTRENEVLKKMTLFDTNCRDMVKKLSLENTNLKEALKMLVHKNKRVLGQYFERIDREDKVRVSFATVLLDFEYMFFFQKLFEMHTFDYIIDRQDPDDKTDLQTKQLYMNCKDFTTNLIKSICYRTGIDVQSFKRSFKTFTDDFIEHTYDKIE